MKKRFFTLTIILTISLSIQAQELSVGSDFVSRYVWRGLLINTAPNIQPSIEFSAAGFSASVWGSYAFSDTQSFSEEVDLSLSYTVADLVTISLFDYYFPNGGKKLGNYKDKGDGAHLVELGLGFSGTETIPVSLYAGINIYNDTDKTLYFEAGYGTKVNEVDLTFTAGCTPGGESLYYMTDKFAFINLGITAGKEIKITNDFSLPIFASWIVNPSKNVENSYLVFGISL